jgi:hypothetical protein
MEKRKAVAASVSRRKAMTNVQKKLNRTDKEIDEDASFGPEEEINEDEILEVLEYGEPGNPDDIVNYRPEDDDEESEGVRELLRDPIRIAPSRKKPRFSSMRIPSRNTEEDNIDQRPKSRWLITTCRYCGNMYRFRSSEQRPPTCGKPQCLAKLKTILKGG